MKIRVESPEHCKLIQRYMFSLGYSWQSGDQIILYADTAKYIMFAPSSHKMWKLSLERSSDDSYFKWRREVELFLPLDYLRGLNL